MINRRLPSTVAENDNKHRISMYGRAWLSAILSVRQDQYLLLRHDQDIPGIGRTKWRFPYCRFDPLENPHKTITAYLTTLTGTPVNVAMLAMPVGRWNETTLYFHVSLDAAPAELHLPPYHDHAWLTPDQLNVHPYFATRTDIEALKFARSPWPGDALT